MKKEGAEDENKISLAPHNYGRAGGGGSHLFSLMFANA